MIQVRRLGHATLTTPDLAPQIEYYTEVVGLTLIERDRTRAIFASKQGLEAIVLELGAPNALSRLAFQVAPGSDLAELARELGKHGINAERRSGNLVLLVLFVVIVGIGLWLVNAMVDARRIDDCISQNLRNCNPIEVSPR